MVARSEFNLIASSTACMNISTPHALGRTRLAGGGMNMLSWQKYHREPDFDFLVDLSVTEGQDCRAGLNNVNSRVTDTQG
jgi:hypothetical protein